MTAKTLTAQDGTPLFYKDWGVGHPIVLAHGWPLNADSFDDLAVALNEGGFRTIAYDRRGFGRSGQPSQGYDYDTLADDMKTLIDGLDLRDVTLLGFSMGGGEVVRYLSRHGNENVRAAILISSVVPLLAQTDDHPEGVDDGVLKEIEDGLREDRPTFFQSFFKDFYGVSLLSHAVSDAVLDWTQQMAMQAGLLPTLQCASAFGTTDFRQELAGIEVPVLLIHGTSDKTVPIEATSRLALSGLRDARLLEYDGAPHGLLATEKQRVAEDILGFLRDSGNRLGGQPQVTDPLPVEKPATMPAADVVPPIVP